mmetsp:Transcript_9634/g.34200  ORF Transcript_9634/g.34200 Transcript_9634/m.34200 type:complete len:414 (+) Transcript_9634:286-1527(+)
MSREGGKSFSPQLRSLESGTNRRTRTCGWTPVVCVGTRTALDALLRQAYLAPATCLDYVALFVPPVAGRDLPLRWLISCLESMRFRTRRHKSVACIEAEVAGTVEIPGPLVQSPGGMATRVAAAGASSAVLPDGRRVRCVSKRDVPFLYREIFQEKCYLKHGVELRPGDTVFDVGANIGLFALFAAERCGSHGKVYAFEPLPETFDALRYNVETFCSGKQMGHVVLNHVGVSDGKQSDAKFTYYASAAGWSSMEPNEEEVREAMNTYLDNALVSSSSLEDTWLAKAGTALARYAPRWLYNAAKIAFINSMLCSRQTASCRLVSVSEAIRMYEVQNVDLLKVDVERAELGVLMGVGQDDWPKIQQCALEVHDLGGERLQEVCALLQDVARFPRVEVEQDVDLRGTKLYNVYCCR